VLNSRISEKEEGGSKMPNHKKEIWELAFKWRF